VRDIVLNPFHGAVQIIDYNHRWTDPLHFVLLFPHGEPGYRPGLQPVRRYIHSHHDMSKLITVSIDHSVIYSLQSLLITV
jgi:hypothetical protein